MVRKLPRSSERLGLVQRRRHINANYYLVCARALLDARAPKCTELRAARLPSCVLASSAAAPRSAQRSSLGSRVKLMRRPWLQALRSAFHAEPDVPVLVLEDDIQVASSFALRLMSWIAAIEARHSLRPTQY